jgi:hypothetical protein
MRQEGVKGLVFWLTVLAGVIGPAAPSSWAQTSPPDIRGIYVGSGAIVQTGCASAANNGTFAYVTSMAIGAQATNMFTAQATFAFSAASTDQATFSGTVSSSGQVSGTLTLVVLNNGVSVATGNGAFIGQVTGNSMALPYAGKFVTGETCTFVGSLTAARLTTALAAAVLPTSRSVQVGSTATAFATIINGGLTTALGCRITPLTSVPADFLFQATDPVTGVPNAAVDIAPGVAQNFVIAFTPTGPFPPTDVQLSFACANSSPAPIISGVNTLLLSASSTPVPDIVALAVAPGNDGIVNVPGMTGTGVFAVATVNVGASASITAMADTGGATLPVNIFLCQTNPTTGQCISAIGPTVTTQINANATPTFALFVVGTGTVPFDPANNRVFVRFKDTSHDTRGSTSVAVRTQ